MRTPPNSPWIPRNATSSIMFWDWPQSAEARTKPIMPMRTNGLRPKRSPSLPAIGTITVEATRYAVVTHA